MRYPAHFLISFSWGTVIINNDKVLKYSFKSIDSLFRDEMINDFKASYVEGKFQIASGKF